MSGGIPSAPPASLSARRSRLARPAARRAGPGQRGASGGGPGDPLGACRTAPERERRADWQSRSAVMERQARRRVQTGTTVMAHLPPIPPAIKRNTLLLAVTQAFVGVGNQVVPALGAIMVLQLLGSPTLAGIATGILGGCRFLVAYPIGAITDRHGRRVGLVLGLVLSLLGALVIGWSMAGASFAVFLLGLVLFGLGVGAGQQLRVAAVDMYPSSRRAEGVGYVLMGSLVGALGGPLLITLAEAWSPRLRLDPLALSWWLVPVVLLPSLGLVQLIRPDPKEIAANLSVYYPESPGAAPLPPPGSVHHELRPAR